MHNGFQKCSFGELLKEKVKNGIYKSKTFHGSGLKIVNMGELFRYPRLYDVDMKRIMVTEKEKDNFLLKNGDLLFARRSLTPEGAGKCCIVHNIESEMVFESSLIRARPDCKKVNPYFLYYYFSSHLGIYLLYTIRRQVAVSGITGTDLMKLILDIPPLWEQQAIAHILGTLDDKIELNLRQNTTLEAMAQAIFKEWFVDFGPVRAKMEGRQPEGMSREVADLFPDRLDDEGKPEGWKIKTIEDVAQKVGMGPFGSSIKVSTFVASGIPIISGKHLNSVMLSDTEYNFVTEKHAEKLKNSNVYRGDIVFTHAGNIGQVSYIPEISMYNKYILSQRQFYMRCDLSIVSPEFIVYFFKSPEGQHKLLANTSSTGVPSISRPVSYIKTISFILPQKNILNVFENIVKRLHRKIVNTKRENDLLISLRDTLLPKLISGELRVPDAQKMVADIV